MKSLSHLLACAALLSLSMIGCERHDFEKTKVLSLEHGGEHHGEEHEGDHKGDHAEHAGEEHKKEEHKKDEKKHEEPEKGEPRETGI